MGTNVLNVNIQIKVSLLNVYVLDQRLLLVNLHSNDCFCYVHYLIIITDFIYYIGVNKMKCIDYSS